MSAGAKDAAEAKPIVFAGPSEEQQQVQVEQAIKEGHLTFSLTQRSSAEKSAIT